MEENSVTQITSCYLQMTQAQLKNVKKTKFHCLLIFKNSIVLLFQRKASNLTLLTVIPFFVPLPHHILCLCLVIFCIWSYTWPLGPKSGS